MPVFNTMCPRCHARDRSCDLCGGRGTRYLHRCPRALTTDDALGALELHRHYEHGYLPVHGGGLEDQPAAYWDQQRIIDSELSEIRAEQLADAQARRG